ncbi:MAG: hypothetical protein HQL72_03610 [Magnetococcales bacterium]|nr:hypothetical protein [Magnetococcales bacterium]
MDSTFKNPSRQNDADRSVFEMYYQLERIDPRAVNSGQAPGIHFWPKILSACAMTITPALARKWLERNEKNRNLKDRKVQELVSTIEDSHWRLNGESICFSSGGRLLDGQHRLHAIAKSGIPAEAVIIFGVDDSVMRTYDQGVKRTNADHFNISGEKNCVVLGATIRLLYMWKTLQFHRSGPKFTPDQETLDKLLAEHPSVRNSVQISKKATRFITSANAAALHFLFSQTGIEMRSGQSAADHFLEKLGSGENITRQDAVYRLREALTENRTSKKLTSIQMRAMTIKAWNIFSQDKKRGRIHWDADEEAFPEIYGLETANG